MDTEREKTKVANTSYNFPSLIQKKEVMRPLLLLHYYYYYCCKIHFHQLCVTFSFCISDVWYPCHLLLSQCYLSNGAASNQKHWSLKPCAFITPPGWCRALVVSSHQRVGAQLLWQPWLMVKAGPRGCTGGPSFCFSPRLGTSRRERGNLKMLNR